MTNPLGTRLASKVAIITGGGSGFGEGIAKRFAQEGCKVIVADRDAVNGARVAAFDAESMYFVEMDVTREEDWRRCVEETVKRWGRVDVLVNNAGTTYRNKVCLPSGLGRGVLMFTLMLIWG
jgi:NAD(P)-dependent dehydrogenase (short-subunit alcohol dehydrogenase family)